MKLPATPKRRYVGLLVGLVALTIVAGWNILSDGPPEAADKSPESAGAVQSPPARGIAHIGGKTYVNGRLVKEPSPVKPTGSPETFDPSSPLPDFINVHRDYDEDSCDPRRGVACRFKFKGNVFLGSALEGHIKIRVMEEGKKDPVASRILEPATKGRNTICGWEQCPYGGAYVDYTPSRTASRVNFIFDLFDIEGRLLMSESVQTLLIRS